MREIKFRSVAICKKWGWEPQPRSRDYRAIDLTPRGPKLLVSHYARPRPPHDVTWGDATRRQLTTTHGDRCPATMPSRPHSPWRQTTKYLLRTQNILEHIILHKGRKNVSLLKFEYITHSVRGGAKHGVETREKVANIHTYYIQNVCAWFTEKDIPFDNHKFYVS